MSRTNGGLAAEGLVRAFGGVRAVDDVTITIKPGQIHGLIGPNGSGKTTLLGLLAGTVRSDEGRITIDGELFRGRGAHAVVRRGVARTFQTTRLFRERTVAENFTVGLEESRRIRRQPAHDFGELLKMTALGDKGNVLARQLSNAEQRRMMILNALSTDPHTILLDEPAVGMSGPETETLSTVIRRVRDELGIAVLVVEHNMHFMMNLAERITVLTTGRVLAEGTPTEVRANNAVIESYLGS